MDSKKDLKSNHKYHISYSENTMHLYVFLSNDDDDDNDQIWLLNDDDEEACSDAHFLPRCPYTKI